MPRTPRGALTLAEEGPRSPGRRRLGAFLTVVLLGVVGAAGYLGVRHLLLVAKGERCQVTASGTTFEWAPDQASNAAAITAIAVKRGLPPRAATIAIATAMQESKVRNVRFGDRDSLGLFQQRPSQGWGSAEQILNPEYSTNKFYDALVKVKGYTRMDIAEAAQEVQRSAAGEAYAQHESQARVTASVLSGQTTEGIGCRLEDPTGSGDADAVAALVEKDFGFSAKVSDDGTVEVALDSEDDAWAVASWAVARATDTRAVRVDIGNTRWDRSLDDGALGWTPIDDGAAAGQRNPTAVTIHLA